MKVGLIQFCVGPEPSENAEKLEVLIGEAFDAGADFVLTPEACNVIQPDRAELMKVAGALEDDPVFLMAQRLAFGIHVNYSVLGDLLMFLLAALSIAMMSCKK